MLDFERWMLDVVRRRRPTFFITLPGFFSTPHCHTTITRLPTCQNFTYTPSGQTNGHGITLVSGYEGRSGSFDFVRQ